MDPLDLFYGELDLVMPEYEVVPAHALSDAGRDLLAHNEDMVARLQDHYQDTFHLSILQTRSEAGALSRLVKLVANRDNRIVEFGAIRIHLSRFSEKAVKLIREGRKPLGNILQTEKVIHRSVPQAYFRLHPDSFIAAAMGTNDESRWLYGRQNVHLNPSGQPLAEVVEILPPA